MDSRNRPQLKIVADGFRYDNRLFKVFQLKRLHEAANSFGGGSIVQDARGRWYLCISVIIDPVKLKPNKSSCGIDLGVKTLATLSTGKKYEGFYSTHYKKIARRIAKAQAAGKKGQAKKLNAKQKNKRLYDLNQIANEIVGTHDFIAVGDIPTKNLVRKPKPKKKEGEQGYAKNGRAAKKGLNKALLGNAHGIFKTMLTYKARRHQRECVVINESYTSRTCSCCGVIPTSAPKGVKGLRVRSWVCDACGAEHDRDINAARNILNLARNVQVPPTPSG